MNDPGSATARPFQRIVPDSAATRPRTARNSVVFPAPTGPVTTVKLPRSRWRSTSSIPRGAPGERAVRPWAVKTSSRSAALDGDVVVAVAVGVAITGGGGAV